MQLLQILLLASLEAYSGPEGGEAAPIADEDLTPADLEGETRVTRDPQDHDFGPFYEEEPTTEVEYPSEREKKWPVLSVGKGAFCFVEDAKCKASLLAAGDIAAGLNIIAGDGGFDVPLTQYRFMGGLAIRPFYLARKQWHPWGLGATVDWSRASGPVAAGETDDGNVAADESRKRIDSLRVSLVNQIWLSQKRNAFHVDIMIGGVQSSVLNFPGRFWGTHAEVAFGFGGWGAVYIGGDFLDQDTRVLVGFRIHGIAAGPAAGLAMAGYAAGGGFSGGGS